MVDLCQQIFFIEQMTKKLKNKSIYHLYYTMLVKRLDLYSIEMREFTISVL
jgi:hypothetical protein